MEWVVQLSGDSSDLEELSKVFTTPELCISQFPVEIRRIPIVFLPR